MKELFKLENNVNFDEYQKLMKKKLFNIYIILFIVFIGLYCFIISELDLDKKYIIVLYSIILFILLNIVITVINKLFLKNMYQKILVHRPYILNYTIKFYDEYIEINNTGSFKKIYYKDVIKIEEENNIISLRFNQIIIEIIKNDGNSELINFIKNLQGIKINQLNNVGYKKTPPLIDLLPLLMLFVPFYAFQIMYRLNPKNPFAYSWIIWCFLPIPIIGAIIENICLEKGYSCNNNIIIIVIISTIMLILGSLFLIFPN